MFGFGVITRDHGPIFWWNVEHWYYW